MTQAQLLLIEKESSEVQKGYVCALISSFILSYKQNTLICITYALAFSMVYERGSVSERDRGSEKEVCILLVHEIHYNYNMKFIRSS